MQGDARFYFDPGLPLEGAVLTGIAICRAYDWGCQLEATLLNS